MTTIAANDIKTHGVNVLNKVIEKDGDAVITVHGKEQFVVTSIEHYNYLRECELEMALQETKRDIEEGRTICESVADHIKRITLNP